MLQQTRVETVVPYYERFLERFPDVHELARAELDEVLSEWAGLGYYHRARSLHKAALHVSETHGGDFPETASELRELPGIGAYTAGAIAAIAFGRPEAAVDGNVIRVLTRLLGIREDVTRPEVLREIHERAAEFAKGEAPADWCQAVMELGALVCAPRAPRCLACPVTEWCDAYRAGDAAALPNKPKKAKARSVEAAAALVLRRGKALAVRRPEGGLLGGLWDLPGGDLEPGEPASSGLARALAEGTGLSLVAEPIACGSVAHVFTHRRLRLHVFRAEAAPGRTSLRSFDAHRWVSPDRLSALPHARLTGKALQLLGLDT
jgi:A/G-specific adenine glycosylase